MDGKTFRLELVRELLSCYNSRKHRKRGRSSMEGTPSCTFSEQHFPVNLSKALQCRVCSTSGQRRRTSYGCKECNQTYPLPLCITPI